MRNIKLHEDTAYSLVLDTAPKSYDDTASDWADPVQVLMRRQDIAAAAVADRVRNARLEAACKALNIRLTY